MVFWGRLLTFIVRGWGVEVYLEVYGCAISKEDQGFIDIFRLHRKLRRKPSSSRETE